MGLSFSQLLNHLCKNGKHLKCRLCALSICDVESPAFISSNCIMQNKCKKRSPHVCWIDPVPSGLTKLLGSNLVSGIQDPAQISFQKELKRLVLTQFWGSRLMSSTQEVAGIFCSQEPKKPAPGPATLAAERRFQLQLRHC